MTKRQKQAINQILDGPPPRTDFKLRVGKGLAGLLARAPVGKCTKCGANREGQSTPNGWVCVVCAE